MAVGRAEITVVADASEFDRQMRRMADSMARAFRGADREATRSFGSTEAAAQRFTGVMSTVQGRLERVRAGFAGTFGSADQFRGAVGRLTSRLRESNLGLSGMADAGRRLTSVFGSVVGIMGRVAAVGSAVGVLAGALGAAAASAVQFAAALAPAVGVIAAFPAVVGVAAAAIATLQVATAGVGEAFAAAASGDAEEFTAALEGLAPSAQAAAVALREITPGFQELQASVQGAFFEGFDQTLLSISATLLGPLTEGMTAAASGLAAVTTRLGEAITSGAGVAFVETSFASLSNILANIQEPLGLLVEAFLSLGSSINIAFGGAEAGAGLGAMIARFAEFVNVAADSGAAIGWVEGAITVFRQLGAILSPIIGIIAAVGQVAQETGGNILGALGGALGAVEAFVSSAEGMAALTTIFTTLNEVGAVFGTVLSGLLPIVAPLVGQLVSGLLPVLQSLAPILVQIGALAAPIFAQILEAVLPLVPPLLQLASQILPLVASVLSLVVAAAAPLLEVLVNLLVSVLTPLIPALEPLLLIFGELAVTLAEALTPIIQLLGEILLWLVETIIIPIVVPIIEFLVNLLGTILVAAVQFLGDQFQSTIEGIVIAATFLKDQWERSTALMRATWTLLQDKLRSGFNFINSNVIAPFRAAFALVQSKFSGIVSSIALSWVRTVNKLKSGVTTIKNAVTNMFSPMWEGFRSAVNSIIRGWNNLSFSIPSVDLGPLGSVGGFTVSTPNIPTLQQSGFSFGEGLVNLHPNEAIVNARDPRGLRMLADAFDRADNRSGGIVFESGAFQITFAGAVPTEAVARRLGRSLGEGITTTLAARRARQGVRNL